MVYDLGIWSYCGHYQLHVHIWPLDQLEICLHLSSTKESQGLSFQILENWVEIEKLQAVKVKSMILLK